MKYSVSALIKKTVFTSLLLALVINVFGFTPNVEAQSNLTDWCSPPTSGYEALPSSQTGNYTIEVPARDTIYNTQTDSSIIFRWNDAYPDKEWLIYLASANAGAIFNYATLSSINNTYLVDRSNGIVTIELPISVFTQGQYYLNITPELPENTADYLVQQFYVHDDDSWFVERIEPYSLNGVDGMLFYFNSDAGVIPDGIKIWTFDGEVGGSWQQNPYHTFSNNEKIGSARWHPLVRDINGVDDYIHVRGVAATTYYDLNVDPVDGATNTLHQFSNDCDTPVGEYIDSGLRIRDNGETVAIAAHSEGQLNSPLRIAKNGVTYSLVLVDPNDPTATNVLIKTTNGDIKALAEFGGGGTGTQGLSGTCQAWMPIYGIALPAVVYGYPMVASCENGNCEIVHAGFDLANESGYYDGSLQDCAIEFSGGLTMTGGIQTADSLQGPIDFNIQSCNYEPWQDGVCVNAPNESVIVSGFVEPGFGDFWWYPNNLIHFNYIAP